jgi:hypothetical protein
MNNKTLKGIFVLVGLPAVIVSLYILHYLISQTNADRLIWFLFWAYIPLIIVSMILNTLIEKD